MIRFERDEIILQCLRRSLKELRWSQTNKAWYVPFFPGITAEIFKSVGHLAYIDYTGVKTSEPEPGVKNSDKVAHKNFSRHLPLKQSAALAPDKEQKIAEFRNWLKSRRYSENTVKTYCEALRTFLRFFDGKPIAAIDNNDVIIFNNQYILQNKLSSSFQNQVVNAIKLFFRTIELRSMTVESVHRPKTEKLLPNVLSKEEIRLILSVQKNIKHRAMLSLVYSCGLRRSELLNLKLNDIDSKRGLVIIRKGKGKKDRIAPLSLKVLDLLREYFLAYTPKDWLFEGQNGIGQYDERSLANVLKQAIEKCKINKPVTLHWLRHSYATHLLENGTDLRYIQEILGHSRSTTTEIYTHVSNKNIQKVISPFDTL
jgi:integrase/recombinase XerD